MEGEARAGEQKGGTGRQGQAREGPACQAEELRPGGEVSREPARLLRRNDLV